MEIPTKKPREDYTAEERRAEMFQIITDLGHPSMVNQTELAEKYDVSQPMIHKDIDEIAESVADRVGEHHALEVESVYRRALKGLLNDGEWRKAGRTVKDYAEWMDTRTELEELREEIEMLKELTGADA